MSDAEGAGRVFLPNGGQGENVPTNGIYRWHVARVPLRWSWSAAEAAPRASPRLSGRRATARERTVTYIGRVGATIARIAARLPRTALLSASLGDERVLLARYVGVRSPGRPLVSDRDGEG